MTEEQMLDTLRHNQQNATGWISTAARAGFPAAQVLWGQLLLEGKGVVRDARAALTWFEKAAAAGDIDGRNMVGRCYEQGWGVDTNWKLATEAFETAAHHGHIWGKVNLAQMLMRTGLPESLPRCFAIFKAVAESGTSKPHLKAMNSLARFLEEGWGGPMDKASAVAWYTRAAKLGDHWAQYNLATILFRQGDLAATDQWLKSAIAISDNGFRRRIALVLLARPELALRRHGLDALAHCAQSNAPEDLYAYGMALAEGIAGSREPDQAACCFKQAALQGHEKAAARNGFKCRLRSLRRFANRAFIVARQVASLITPKSLSEGEEIES